MLNNSLQTRGVTRQVSQSGNGQTVNQVTRLSLEAERNAQSQTVLVQEGDRPTTVVTESIGTPTTDYVRYTSIDTAQTKANGDKLDFGSILNVWGNSETEGSEGQTDGELYNESVLGVVPFGRLDKQQRTELLDFIRSENVYEVDYGSVQRTIENGRPRYAYPVTVDAAAYILLLKRYGEMSGLNQLGTLDPGSYEGSERLPFTLVVDVWSRQLKRIDFGDGQRVENFTGHNASRGVTLPKDAIDVNELQSRLQELQ